MNMHYAFHPALGEKCVPTSEYEKLLSDGWFDTPAKFPVAGIAADDKTGIPTPLPKKPKVSKPKTAKPETKKDAKETEKQV